MNLRGIKLIKKSFRTNPNHLTKAQNIVYSPGSRAVRPWRFQGGRGVQRGLGGNPNPPVPLGPAQRVACWNMCTYSIEVYRNQNWRLRLLSDSCLLALRAWVTLGCRPNPPGDFIPSPLLRFAPIQVSYCAKDPFCATKKRRYLPALIFS